MKECKKACVNYNNVEFKIWKTCKKWNRFWENSLGRAKPKI